MARNFSAFERILQTHGCPHPLADLFAHYYEQLAANHTGLIREQDIEPVCGGDVTSYGMVGEFENYGLEMAEQAVIIKLNGGLGTSMGMPHAKSLLPVMGKETFLDVILRQTKGCCEDCGFFSPLILMNSFSTHQDTLNALKRAHASNTMCFVQHRFPKILREDLTPALWPSNPQLEWNPPGHGDVYATLFLSGTLDKLLEQGRRFAFISNADNLGATLDMSLLGYMARKGLHFLMEVAERTPADKKGGHLAKTRNGGFILREVAQCPVDEVEGFQDINRFCLFNTNNIWVDLAYLRELIQNQGLPKLPMIINPKNLDPRDKTSPKVYQVETAMGAAISVFEKAEPILTPTSRFIPVKKTSDLLAVRSDCYIFDEHCRVVRNPKRSMGQVLVDLDSKHYATIDQLEERFPEGPPSLLHCRSFSVKGDVLFLGNTTALGDVKVANPSSMQAVVAAGTTLDGRYTLAEIKTTPEGGAA